MAALVGGYLFGFSAYVVTQSLGHPHISAVFLLPLMALGILRHVRGELAAGGLAWRLGLVLGWQLWLSTELSARSRSRSRPGSRSRTCPSRAAAAAEVAPPPAGRCLRGVALAAPLLAYALSGVRSESINEPAKFSADVLNIVVPTHVLALTTAGLTRISAHFPGNDAEQGAYLGLPTLAIAIRN